MNDYKAKVLKEFDKLFLTDDGDYSYIGNDADASTVKDFLTRALDGQVEEIREQIKNIHANPFKDSDDVIGGYMLCKAQVLTLIPSPSKE